MQQSMMQGTASFSGRIALPVTQHPAHIHARGSSLPCAERDLSRNAGRLCPWTIPADRCSSTATRAYFEMADAPVLPLPGAKGGGMETVGDVMTFKKIFFVRPDTTIDEALEILVNNKISGMPVLDSNDKLVGVVSDFDLLSLDHISGERQTSGMFPDITTDWPAFEEVQKLILKNHGKVVEDVMTANPFTVDRGTALEKAARLLLDKRIRRLPVVDENLNLVGMFSRGDVIRAALKARSLIRSITASQDPEVEP